ncbi:DNA replication factor DNA2 (macronuclear) [Tetrahymena thermophila SB210]|uniref:DNA replication factor DNA2 n=1 Tax=Tetrahymena thermophila (strain SB210) TaxID=312017 RepID=W7XGV7_TETTS|nr:DNA replication factor DNA2 [Tetrahymena thermophila SB210]EWS73491.1 DNA replication factor DNA2 [Tetrahymena thermophila SB210]|eukprot:XP_012653973.1 DNA replication factor DNA2 [Tetrahymena thermophila SB210]
MENVQNLSNLRILHEQDHGNADQQKQFSQATVILSRQPTDCERIYLDSCKSHSGTDNYINDNKVVNILTENENIAKQDFNPELIQKMKLIQANSDERNQEIVIQQESITKKLDKSNQNTIVDQQRANQVDNNKILEQINLKSFRINEETESNLRQKEQPKESSHFQYLLEQLNNQKYVSFMVTKVESQKMIKSESKSQPENNEPIPEQYWQAFQKMIDQDEIFGKKYVEKTQKLTYLRLKVINNTNLQEQLRQVEIGLLLVEKCFSQIQYEVEDKINFIGKFNYQIIQTKNENDIVDNHLFFSVLNEEDINESNGRYETRNEVFKNNNILILEPDINLPASLIAKSEKCYRSSLIKMKFKANESASWPLLKCFMLRDLFQHLISMVSQNEIQKNTFQNPDYEFLDGLVNKIHTKYLENLFLIDKKLDQIKEEIIFELIKMLQFFGKYFNGSDRQIYKTKFSQRGIKMLNLAENQMFVNNDILGINGYIDYVFSCEVEDYLDRSQPKQTLQFPFEVKTGKNIEGYYEQNLLYCLLLNYKLESNQNLEGFLFQLAEDQDQLKSICPTKQLASSIFNIRNKVAKLTKTMNTSGKVPQNELKSENTCKRCYEREACYASKVADGLDNLKDIEDVVIDKQLEDHSYSIFQESLSKKSKLYLKKWLDLIEMEQQFDSEIKYTNLKNLQYQTDNDLLFVTENFDQFFIPQVEQLQKKNSNLDVKKSENNNKLTFQFVEKKENCLNQDIEAQKDYECVIHLKKIFPQDKKVLAISDLYKEGESFALFQNDIKCRFFAVLEEKVVEEQNNSIILKLKSNQEQVNFDQKRVEKILQNKTGNSLLWSVELNDLEYYSVQRQNVLNLILNRLINQNKRYKKLLFQTEKFKQKNKELIKVIIGNTPPKFQNNQFSEDRILSILDNYPNLLINEDQQDSVRKVLKSESLTCIQGMPGTGKTYLIVHLIKILTNQNKTLLITSYTNSALDNIIVKLLDLFPELSNMSLRIGSNKNLVHSIAQGILFDPSSFTNEKHFADQMKNKKIFFATIIGSNNKLLQSSKISFDYCIIDEASQCVEPLCLGPMLICNKSILIGDHQQLQPIIKNEEAGKLGYSISLFERMCNQYPSCYIKLKNQFRMNNSIMELSNIMVYQNQLKAFDNNIGNSLMQINEDELQKIRNKCINYCLQPSNKVVFIDTSFYQNEIIEKDDQEIVCKQPIEENIFQVKLICLLIKRLQDISIQNKNMALVTPYNFYRYQVQKNLKLMKIQQQDLQLFTVDKSQGQERDVIILHITDKIGCDHLLSNFRRTNVALTRSKMKLIIVGNKNILKKNNIIDQLMTILLEKNYVYQLNQLEVKEIFNEFVKLQNDLN